MMTRSELLHAAEVCVCGQREEDYGTPEDNFRVIGELWETYIKEKCVGDPAAEVCIVPEDVAVLLALLNLVSLPEIPAMRQLGRPCGLCGLRRRAAEQTGGVRQMKRLTVDTDLSFCDIAQCDSIPGGSFCEDGR